MLQAEQPSTSLSAGQMLRAAREARGIHLALLSVNLKVSVRQLEALEADRYDVFKGTTFVRALAQSVCRQLKINPEPVLQALPRGDAQKMLEPIALEAHRTTVVTATRSGVGLGFPRQVLALAALMLAGAGALIWWPGSTHDVLRMAEVIQDSAQAAVPMGQASDPVEVVTAAASAELPAASAVPVPVPTVVAKPQAAASATPVAAAPVAVKPLAPASSPMPAVMKPAEPASEVSASQPAMTSKEAPLLIKVSSDVWITVRDNHGQTLIRRQVKAGEIVKMDITPPLFVYAGRADAVELRWRGKPMNLQPHTQNNEVRLLIKP